MVREQVRTDQHEIGLRTQRHPPRRQHGRERERLVVAQRRAREPAHRAGDAPVGLMLVGETGGDRRLLAVAAAVEAELQKGAGA